MSQKASFSLDPIAFHNHRIYEHLDMYVLYKINVAPSSVGLFFQ